MKQTKAKDKTLILVESAMLAALSVVLMLTIRFWLIPGAKFLEYDMGDIPVIISTLLFGPGAGILTLTFVSAIQALTVSAASSWQGFIMHVFASGAYITVMYLIYNKNRTKKRLIISQITGAACMTIIMIPLNLIFTPMYLGVPVKAVAELILPAILPFNLIKGLLNCAISVLLFIPLKKILSKSHLLPTKN